MINPGHCRGCRDDIYNNGHLGVTECWHLKTAKLISRKRVDIRQVNATHKPQRYPDCYHQDGYSFRNVVIPREVAIADEMIAAMAGRGRK